VKTISKVLVAVNFLAGNGNDTLELTPGTYTVEKMVHSGDFHQG
jgi:hypothetical protein